MNKELNYSKEFRKLGYQGRVYIQFTVKKDGTLSNFEILKTFNLHEMLAQEALRVIKVVTSKPKTRYWTPAQKKTVKLLNLNTSYLSTFI